MAQIYGVVAEFNPFHNGHAALAAHARELGAGAVVAVMSGNIVQRGSVAVTDKRVRAEAALRCGIDLLFELPLPYACAPAQRFARGAVGLLAATGQVDGLLFGSESGDLQRLCRVATALDAPALQPLIRQKLAEGTTFARARQQVLAAEIGERDAALLEGPNNTLAVEYIRAASELGWAPAFATICRQGTAHDSRHAAGAYASASLLRENPKDFAHLGRYVPPQALATYARALAAGLYPADASKLENAMIAHLRRLSPGDLAGLPDLSEGIENRLYTAIRRTATLGGLEIALKTKRYTMARVRRLIMAAFLGITAQDVHTPPPYLRVLGFTPRGREILSAMKHTCRLPVSQSLVRLRERGGTCERFAALEEQSTDLYVLALPQPPGCGYEYTASAIFLK